MVAKFAQRLCQRGYPQHLFNSIANQVSYARREQYLSGSSSRKAVGCTKAVLSLPYAGLVRELRLPQLLREEYMLGGEALHACLKQRPIVAYSKNRNLGSLLVKASH